MKLLLVDDCEINRRMIGIQLEKRGFEVVKAADGNEAYEQARVEKPDLILMDLVLPRLNGIQAAAKIKADEEVAEIPIIALTGFCTYQEQREAMRAGCGAVATKPIDFGLLDEMIGQLTAQHA